MTIDDRSVISKEINNANWSNESEDEANEVVPITEANALGTLAGIKLRRVGATTLGRIILIYGQGGAGKTKLASDLRKLGKTLHLDAEGGTDVLEDLKGDPDYVIADIVSYAKFHSAVAALKMDTRDYVNIIVDNLSELVELKERELGITGNDGHDLQKYNLVRKAVSADIRTLRNITRTRNVNIVLICWDSDEKDDRGILKKDLYLTPKLRGELPGIITIVGHVRVLSDPNKRMLDFAPSPRTVSKFKRSADSPAMAVPYKITYDVKHLPLADVIRTIKGEGSWPTKTYTESNEKDE